MDATTIGTPLENHGRSVVPYRDLLVFLAFFLTIRWFITKRKDAQSDFGHLPLPPSPPGLPLVGNMFSLRTNMRPILREWTRELGGIFNIRVGSKNMVLISDIDVMHEAFIKKSDRFAGRDVFILSDMAFGRKGSVFMDDEKWKRLRRLTHQALRSFGVGKSSMEKRIKGECEGLVDFLEKNSGSPFNPQFALSNLVANITISIVAGHRYEYDDPVFQGFMKSLYAFTANLSATSPAIIMPILFYTPVCKEFRNAALELKKLMKVFISEHNLESQKGGDFRDIVEFIGYDSARRRKLGLIDDVVEKGREWRLILDMFIAGIATTSDTLYWALLLMAKYPDVLEECQKEIDDVIGNGRYPTMADKEKMPYVSATIQEIMRYRPVVPLGVPHESDEESDLCGYRIPGRSVVVMNIWEIFMSPKHWDEPDKFNPRRFLSKDGQTVLKPPAFVPFGMGPRMCLGENLGRMTSFLVFAHILQRFTFRLAENSQSVDMDGIYSVTLMANDYELIIKERQLN